MYPPRIFLIIIHFYVPPMMLQLCVKRPAFASLLLLTILVEKLVSGFKFGARIMLEVMGWTEIPKTAEKEE